MVILVPAYEPDHRLIDLVRDIRDAAPASTIVIVDDGSGPTYTEVFDQARRVGCDVLSHQPNRGKGFALKRGFAHVVEHHPGEAVVCADADGQHTIGDIIRVGDELDDRYGTIALGSRAFAGRVPLLSRIGNDVTRLVFSKATGVHVRDTQTGLRAYCADLIDELCGVEGDRFEYELNVLLWAVESGRTLVEVPIETIYEAGNRSSHFRPVVDSVRVYGPLLRFAMSGLVAFALDVVLLFVGMAMTGNLLLSVVGARLLSSTVNFLTNRGLVFDAGRDTDLAIAGARYVALMLLLLAGNYTLMHVLTERLGMDLAVSKAVVEAALFTISYQVQKGVVFAPATEQADHGRQRVE